MKTKFSTIRYKLMLSFFASAIMAMLSMLVLFALFASVFYYNLNEILLWINNHIIVMFLLSVIIFILIMNLFFILLTKNSMNYIDEINKTLEKISSGTLDINIPIKSSDELGELAATVNSMASKLKLLIEEERSWERIKNNLITDVSHDLRTPLTSILGYMELIANVKCTDEENLKHYVNIAHSKCQQLKLLIDDLFEYSKLNNDKMIISKVNINLGELLKQVVIGFMPSLLENGMEYRLCFVKEKIIINADSALIARLFDNLISNSINYGKEGKYIDIELKKDENEAIVNIINYGKPIPQADLPYIFEKFYRVDKSRSRNNGGSGLGLAIVKSIAEKHKGTIRADSFEDKVIFEIRLPLTNI